MYMSKVLLSNSENRDHYGKVQSLFQFFSSSLSDV